MAYLTTTYGSSRISRASARMDRANGRFDLFAVALSTLLLALAFVAHANGFVPPIEDPALASDAAP